MEVEKILEKAVKYDVLVNYIKVLINKDDVFIRTENLEDILKSMEEGEKSE